MSDPASRASGLSQARRAGSLTPRVSVQIVRTNAARIDVQIGAQFRAQIQITIAPTVVLVIELPAMSYSRLTNRWSFSGAHRSCSCG